MTASRPRLIYTPGVFDVLHLGHVNLLRRARALGDSLTVGVQEDRSVLAQKGSSPMHPLRTRLEILLEMRCVDDAISYNDIDQSAVLQALRVTCFVVGAEYGSEVAHQRTLDFCQSNGIEVVRLPRTPGVSSSRIRSDMAAFWAGMATSGDMMAHWPGLDLTRLEVTENRILADHARGTSLLDLGCGDGRLLGNLASRFRRVVGVERCAELATSARQSHPHVELVACAAEEFASEASFDVVLMFGLLIYLNDEQFERLVGRLASLLQEGGRVIVRTPVGVGSRLDIVNQFSSSLGTIYTAYYRTSDEIVEALSQSALKLRFAECHDHRHGETGMWFGVFDVHPGDGGSAP